jgi:peptidyl-prolyl cis-trans isomerase B (cyclophilin B)
VPTEKQRREAERRRLRRQQRRRAQREARRRRYAVIGSIVGTLVLIAIVVVVVVATNNDKSPKPAGADTSPTPTGTATTAASTCTWTASGNASKQGIAQPPADPPTSGTANILVQTSRGPMTFQLNRTAAPCAVASFVSLAQQQYFNDTPCHRLTTSGIFVLQCGDPLGNGQGGPGYTFGDELTGQEKYTRGVLAMANSGAGTNGSQFFIVYKRSTLSPNYTVFGRVTSGLNVVDKVAAAGSNNANGAGDGKPKLPMTLTTVALVE